MLLWVIEGKPLPQLLQALGQRTLLNQVRPQGPMGDHAERRVLRTLGQGEELPGQLYGLVRFRPHAVKVPDPPQGGKELRSLSDLLAELARSTVRLLHFRGGISPGG